MLLRQLGVLPLVYSSDLVFTNEPHVVRDITYFQVWKTAIMPVFAFPNDVMPTIKTYVRSLRYDTRVNDYDLMCAALIGLTS